MDIINFYESIGVSHLNILNRLGSPSLISKYLNIFAKDGSYIALQKSISEKDYTTAFRYAHTLKGICLNLELKPLTEAAVILSDSLRQFNPQNESAIIEQFNILTDIYQSIIDKIEEAQ